MGERGGYSDLHLHTTASDGTSTFEERVEQALEKDLSVISITDHDRITSVLKSPTTHVDDLEVVTGVEIRADLFDTKVEILGYYVDPGDGTLNSLLEKVRGYREKRNREMVERLAEATGIDLSYEELESEAEGSLGRPHMAQKLIDEGKADSVGDAFDEYLGEGGEAYVSMERAPYDEVVDAVHASGGVASLAHPGRIRDDRVPEMVADLAKIGLDGIEVWYPYGEVRSSDYADVGVEEADALADEHDLVRTGGSDCHGPGSGKYRIGEVTAPRSSVSRLRELSSV